MGRYSDFISNYPYVVLGIDIGVAALSMVILFNFHGVPSLESTSLGFFPKGTDINSWSSVGRHIDTLSQNKTLTSWPNHKQVTDDYSTLPHILVRSQNNSDLLHPQAFHDLCKLQEQMQEALGTPCQIHSLTNDMLAVTNISCGAADAHDTDLWRNVITTCFPFYLDGSLDTICDPSQNDASLCSAVPSDCYNYPVQRIASLYMDTGFTLDSPHLTYTAMFFKESCFKDYDDLVDFAAHNMAALIPDAIDVVAFRIPDHHHTDHIGHKQSIDFEFQLMAFVVLLIAITILVGLYINSFLLLVVFYCILTFSWFLGWFLYYIVFRISAFPGISFCSAFLLIAISVNDLFVMDDLWARSKREAMMMSTEESMREVLYHCSTSVSIAHTLLIVGFLCSLISPIVEVKLFAVFCICWLLSHWFYIITLLPSMYVIRDKFIYRHCGVRCAQQTCLDRIIHAKLHLWRNLIPQIITKLHKVLIVIFTLLTVGGIIATFIYPKWKVHPSSQYGDLASFNADHSQYKDNFRFYEIGSQFQVLWGWQPSQDNAFSVAQTGVTKIDFDISDPFVQEELLNVCGELLNSTLIRTSPNMMCLLREIHKHAQLACKDNVTSCCGTNFLENKISAHVCLQTMDPLYIAKTNILGSFILNDTSIVGFRYNVNISLDLSHLLYSEKRQLLDTWDAFMMDTISSPKLSHGWYMEHNAQELDKHDMEHSLRYSAWTTTVISFILCGIVLLISTMNLYMVVHILIASLLCTLTIIGVFSLLSLNLEFPVIFLISPIVTLPMYILTNFGVAYMHAFPDSRPERVTEAVSVTGSAVTCSASVGIVSSGILCFIYLPGFFEFGLALIFIIFLSWLYAAFFLLPFLHLIGPRDRQGDILWWLWNYWKPKWLKKSSPNKSLDEDYIRDVSTAGEENKVEEIVSNSLSDIMENSTGLSKSDIREPEPIYASVNKVHKTQNNVETKPQPQNFGFFRRKSSKNTKTRIRGMSKNQGTGRFDFTDEDMVSSITNNVAPSNGTALRKSSLSSEEAGSSNAVFDRNFIKSQSLRSEPLKVDNNWAWGKKEPGQGPAVFMPSYLSRNSMRSSVGSSSRTPISIFQVPVNNGTMSSFRTNGMNSNNLEIHY